MRLRPRTALLLLPAVFGIAVVYFWLTPLAVSGVEVAIGVCDQSQSLETSAHGNWVAPVYQLAIDQPENCGVALHSASVQRLGSHLFVRTKYRSPSGMSRHAIAGIGPTSVFLASHARNFGLTYIRVPNNSFKPNPLRGSA